MKPTFRLLPVLALASLLMTPVDASAPPAGGQGQQIDDLRRRVDVIEQRMFQQQLAQPTLPQSGLQQLELRLRQLEVEIASERISQTTAAVLSRRADPENKKSIEARLDELEMRRAADAATIASLTKRLEALEKPVGRIVPLRKDR